MPSGTYHPTVMSRCDGGLVIQTHYELALRFDYRPPESDSKKSLRDRPILSVQRLGSVGKITHYH